ncbi:MAG: hypothetical protein H6562_17650 [Lewinellaceae bacterium]|nr:hypothetical protein [Lewinella sp.]MCB9280722.1 hypothetical protein [Lewinellaceae bacterium]
MKEISLKPTFAENSAAIEKITNWKEEIRFWIVEVNAFLNVTAMFKLNCKPREKDALEETEMKMTVFQRQILPGIESSVKSLELAVAGRYTGGLFREVETKIERGRKTYREIKAGLLPFFPKFVHVQIW